MIHLLKHLAVEFVLVPVAGCSAPAVTDYQYVVAYFTYLDLTPCPIPLLHAFAVIHRSADQNPLVSSCCVFDLMTLTTEPKADAEHSARTISKSYHNTFVTKVVTRSCSVHEHDALLI